MSKSSKFTRSFFAFLVILGSMTFAIALEGQQVAATIQLPNTSPISLALDAADEILYVGVDVGGSSTGAVYGIYIPNGSIIGSISIPGEPQSMAYSPANGLLYATNINNAVNSNINVINTKANPVTTSTLQVGPNASFIALNPVNGKVYVANFKGPSVSVIDPSHNNSVTTVPIQTMFPEFIAFDPGSGEVYVTAYDFLCSSCTGTLTVIDPTTNAVTTTVPVGRLPIPIAIDPSTHNVYVGNTEDGTVSVVSPSNGYAVTSTISIGSSSGPSALALDASGKVYAALANVNQVAVINPARGYAVTPIAVGTTPKLVTFDSGANLMAVLNTGSATVSYISPTSFLVTATVAVGVQASLFAMITNGTYKGTAVTNGSSGTVSLITD